MNAEKVLVHKERETPRTWEFSVSVENRNYAVELEKEYWRTLTNEKVSANNLVFHSFLFLLAREPKESILSSFNLKEINTYFPEYEKEIRKLL